MNITPQPMSFSGISYRVELPLLHLLASYESPYHHLA